MRDKGHARGDVRDDRLRHALAFELTHGSGAIAWGARPSNDCLIYSTEPFGGCSDTGALPGKGASSSRQRASLRRRCFDALAAALTKATTRRLDERRMSGACITESANDAPATYSSGFSAPTQSIRCRCSLPCGRPPKADGRTLSRRGSCLVGHIRVVLTRRGAATGNCRRPNCRRWRASARVPAAAAVQG